mgnify:CR=1 FL=1
MLEEVNLLSFKLPFTTMYKIFEYEIMFSVSVTIHALTT